MLTDYQLKAQNAAVEIASKQREVDELTEEIDDICCRMTEFITQKDPKKLGKEWLTNAQNGLTARKRRRASINREIQALNRIVRDAERVETDRVSKELLEMAKMKLAEVMGYTDYRAWLANTLDYIAGKVTND